jgi:hypothetical protein
MTAFPNAKTAFPVNAPGPHCVLVDVVVYIESEETEEARDDIEGLECRMRRPPEGSPVDGMVAKGNKDKKN